MAEAASERTEIDAAAPDSSGVSEARGESSTDGRYRIVERDGARVVISRNAPNIALHLVPGLSVDERGRKQFEAQTIFLDGVYTGPPFLDNEARHYSLDHHAGCVRSFTLATCEQAVVILLQGLPLASGTWQVYINDPDLDSMLAAWVLFNHVELLRDERALLERAMPMIRLEGVIDAHGTDRELLAAFPPELHARAKAVLDELMVRERELKKQGVWFKTDWQEYACEALGSIDTHLIGEQAVGELLELPELGRASLTNDRIAVLVTSDLGIYEVEARLKDRYGATLGLIVLEIGKDRYTLRLCDAFLRANLEAVYKALNRADPKVSGNNRWGGSGDIGGSPRAEGSGLSGEQILEIVHGALGPKEPWWERVLNLFLGWRKKKASPKALPPGR
ncbi:MAG: hypothetical protein AB7S26_05175 [Sandaracinaceae bacterium]